jgi:hypothetical protein
VIALWGRHKASPYNATPNIKEPEKESSFSATILYR